VLSSVESRLRALFGGGRPADLQALAADPDLPLELLHALAGSHPGPAASNPLWPLLLTSDPDVLASFPRGSLDALLGCDEGAWLLPVAASSPTAEVRAAVASCPSQAPCMPGLLARLAEDPALWVRAQIAERQGLGDELLRRLAGDPEHEVRNRIATNPETPVELLPALASDPELEVRRGATLHPRFPVELLAKFAASTQIGDRSIAAEHPACPPELLRVLASDPSREIRFSVACNEATPPATLATMASDPIGPVRQRVAGNRATPPSVLRALVDDPESAVQAAVAGNACVPVEVVPLLAKRNRGVRGALLRNKALHAETLTEEILAGIGIPQKLKNMAQNAELSPALLGRLAAHPDPEIRLLVAANPGCPAEALKRLALDPDPRVSGAPRALGV